MNFASQKFFEFYKKNPLQTTVNILLSMTFPLDDFLIPFLVSKIVDAVQSGKPWLPMLIVLIVIFMGMQLVYSGTSLHDAIITPKMENFIRHEMFSNLLFQLQYSYKEPVIGEVMSRIIKIPITVSHLYQQFKNYLLVYLISFVITAIYIMSQDLILGIVVLIAVFFVFATIVVAPITCVSATGKQDEALSKIDEEIEDVMANIKTVYANNQIPDELQRLETFEHEYSEKYLRTIKCTMGTRFISITVLGAMMSFIAYRSYYGIKNKTMTTGAFVAIFLILTQWFSTLSWLIDTIRDMTVHWGILNAYEKMVKDNMPDDNVANFMYDIKPPSQGILFYDLDYRIKNKQILNNVLYYIPSGARVVLTGEIGSGKSTLLKLMLGLIKPSNGDIYLDGKAVSKLSKPDLRYLISYSPQNPILFNRSVYENITYGIKNVDRNRVIELIKELELEGALDLEKSAGKGGSALSGGQRQMVSLMRVMLINPKFIVLDEITSSLDSATKAKLFPILNKLFVNKTVIMVTHDDDLLKLGNMHIKMKDGKLHKERL